MQGFEDKNLAPIKGRIYKVLKIKNISQATFSSDLGIALSSFRSKAGKSEFGGEILAKILAYFPDISARWLLTGEGSMFTEGSGVNIHGSVASNNNIRISGSNNKKIVTENSSDKSDLVSLLQQQLKAKDDHIKSLSEMLSKAQDTILALSSPQ